MTGSRPGPGAGQARSVEGYPEVTELLVSLDAGALWLTLDRPEALNALTPEMADELTAVLTAAENDERVRVIVLTGSPTAFCAGGDIERDAVPVSSMTTWEYYRNVERLSAPVLKLAETDRPVIAAVNGVAVGGGWDLALACDIRIAADSARFRDAYVQLGVLPELGGTYLLPRFCGPSRAKIISFSGDFLSAQDAQRFGLVDDVVPLQDLVRATTDLAAKIASGPPRSIRATKVAMNRELVRGLRDALEYAKMATPPLLAEPAFREALAGFLAKRSAKRDG